MERKAIHDQITTLLDKINHLNENVKGGQKLHPVEVDLFLGYLKELHDAVLKLTEFEVQTPDKPEPDIPTKQEENIKPEPTPVIEKNGSQKVKIKSVQAEAMKPESKSQPVEPEIPKEEKTPIIASVKKESSTLNDRFKNDSTELAEKLKKGNKKKLKDSMDIAQKYIYINELFSGNAEQFNKSLKELDQCRSVEEAVSYIQNLETIFPWKEKSKYAKQFKDSVIQSLEV